MADYSALTPGTRLQAESDGVFYAAEVVMVSKEKKRSRAPVKVHFLGYTADSDVWVGADRLRSKAIKLKGKGDEADAAAAGGKRQGSAGAGAGAVRRKGQSQQSRRLFSLADQVARYERAKKENNERYINISSVYDPTVFKDKRVLVIGASRGLGLEIAKALVAAGAEAIGTSRGAAPDLEAAGVKQVVSGVEVTSLDSLKKMGEQIKEPLDYVIFNAGIFPNVVDNLESLAEAEAIKQFDTCAMGPVRAVAALKATGHLPGEKGAKVAIITSQAGSARWRFTQNKDKGGDYGHHMCRAACNIAGVLMSEELKAAGVPVVLLHPGFNRTEMTQKYSEIWDKEGAVPAEDGAKRVLYEVGKVTLASSGKYINCEDGLQIPF